MGDAWGRKIVGLGAAIALAAGCRPPAVPARDATTALAPGVAEPQPTQAPAAPPGTSAAEATAPTTATSGTSAEASADEGSNNARHDPHRTRRVLGWISLTVGAEAAVIAVATSLLIEHQKSIRDDNCNAQKVCNTQGFGAVNTIDTIIPWNTATWFVAAVGLGAGAVLVLVSQPESEKQVAVTVSPVSSGLALGLRSTF